MPSATNGPRTVKSISPDLGSAPGSSNPVSTGSQLTGTQSEAMKQVLVVLEKKVRNMEKKKSKLDDYQIRNGNGERLNQDQLEALSKYQEVANNLEFARELHKSFLTLGQEIQKTVKKAARREQLQREEAEQKRLKKVLELQFVLDRLGDESIRQELLQGSGSLALISEADLTALDDFYKMLGPERDHSVRLADQYQEASRHLWELLEGKDKPVAGTTYKALNETLERLFQSGYFDRAPPHQNGVCAEEEEPAAAEEVSEAEKLPTDAAAEATEEYAEPEPIEVTEFVNRQFVTETTYGDEEQEEWRADSEVETPVHQTTPSPVAPEAHPLPTATPTPHADSLFRKQVVQDLMAQMQGPYNFMQDSMLEFDGQAFDPAIVSAQPMIPGQCLDLAPLACRPGLVQAEPPQMPLVSSAPETFSTPAPLFQSSLPAETRAQAETIDPVQASNPVTEQPAPAGFQPGPKPLHSSGINVNAAPFQSMQTVFNLNAPVPPVADPEALKQPVPYQNSYSPAFNSQTQLPAEQSDAPPEPLQSVAFHPEEQSLPTSHSSALQGNGFSRPHQAFYSSRGTSRGPRNSRGVINGYRGHSNGFRGGYDGYRPPFPNPTNAGYGQNQFNASRDYSNSSYQRDGYQPNYKRGSGQGSRGVSRGSPSAMRS